MSSFYNGNFLWKGLEKICIPTAYKILLNPEYFIDIFNLLKTVIENNVLNVSVDKRRVYLFINSSAKKQVHAITLI